MTQPVSLSADQVVALANWYRLTGNEPGPMLARESAKTPANYSRTYNSQPPKPKGRGR